MLKVETQSGNSSFSQAVLAVLHLTAGQKPGQPLVGGNPESPTLIHKDCCCQQDMLSRQRRSSILSHHVALPRWQRM